METPFEQWWIGTDLGKYRACDGTYRGFALDSVPPLTERFLGTFGWLSEKPVKPGKTAAAQVARLTAAAEALGLTVPPALGYFFSRPALYSQVPSCTACEWDLSAAPVANLAEAGAYTVRVLRDQQDCYFWYLYFPPKGAAPYMIVSPVPFDDPDLQIDQETAGSHMACTAPDFESFVYRFWIENVLWDLVNGNSQAFTPAEQAYLAHYEAALAAERAAKKQKAAKKAKAAAAKKVAAAKKPAARKATAAKKPPSKQEAKPAAKKKPVVKQKPRARKS